MKVLKSKFLLIKYSVPAISIEWTNMSSIKGLSVMFSKYQKQSPGGVLEKGVLKIKILQISLKNTRDAIFNLIKFQAKGLQPY